MGQTISVIDPVSRVEGHLSLEITTADGKVEEALVKGTMYRGFENLFAGKQPDDARTICQRVCGVCPTSHGLAAVNAMQHMIPVILPDNAYLLRNLLLGAEFLHSHILHFYHLCVPDYIEMPATSPWGPVYGGDKRLPAAEAEQLFNHAVEAFRQRQKAHTIGAMIGGRMPHSMAIVIGGITGGLNAEQVENIDRLLNDIHSFIETRMVPDLARLETHYPDYYEIGKGTGHFISFGGFWDPKTNKNLFAAGYRDAAGRIMPISSSYVTESTYYSWYQGDFPGNPFGTTTVPDKNKSRGYSWIKAPRYVGQVCEVGPFARLAVSGSVQGLSSVMGRIRARVEEARLLTVQMKTWLAAYKESGPTYVFVGQPSVGCAVGTVEAPRGSLAHYVTVCNGAIDKYQIVTPTCWNCSPKDERGCAGVLEHAAVGTSVEDEAEPIEVMRIVHSLDPCMACSVH